MENFACEQYGLLWRCMLVVESEFAIQAYKPRLLKLLIHNSLLLVIQRLMRSSCIIQKRPEWHLKGKE